MGSGRAKLLAPIGRRNMKKPEEHLSPDLIASFVNGPIILRRSEFRHLQDCDQCSQIWWDLKREGLREASHDLDEKSAA